MKQVKRGSGAAFLQIAIGCLLSATCHTAWAQNAALPAAAVQGEASLDEIVITANKVSEDLEKAPLAVTAITGTTNLDQFRSLPVLR